MNSNRLKGLGIFSKLSRKSLSDLSEWNKNDDRLVQCVEENKLNEIQSLVKKKKAIATKLDPQGHSAFHVAAMRNKFEVVQLLIAYNASVTAVDFQGRTALHCAARHGASEVLEVLCNCKDDNWPLDDAGMTALHHACIGGNIDCVLSLVRKFPGHIESVDMDGRSPLFYAAQIGHYQVCKELLDRSASINVSDRFGRSPLMCAAENGNEAICDLFIKKGADIELKDQLGHTAMWHAMDAGHTGVRKLLSGEQTEVVNLEETTPSKDYSHLERVHSPIIEETESLMGDETSIKTLLDNHSELTLSDAEDRNNNKDGKDDAEDNESATISESEDGRFSPNLSELSYTMSNLKEESSVSFPRETQLADETPKQSLTTEPKQRSRKIVDSPVPQRSASLTDQAHAILIDHQITERKPQTLALTETGVMEDDDVFDTSPLEKSKISSLKKREVAESTITVHHVRTSSADAPSESEGEDVLNVSGGSLTAEAIQATEQMDLFLQLSELESQSEDKSVIIEELKRELLLLKEQLQTTEQKHQLNELENHISDDDNDWLESDSESDPEVTTIKEGNLKSGDRPIAKVSGQPRKLSIRQETLEIAELKHKNHQLENMNSELTSSLVQAQARDAELEAERHLMTDELSATKQELVDSQKEVTQTKLQAQRYKDKSLTLTEHNHAHKKEVERLRQKIELYDREYRKTKDRLKRKDNNEKKMLKDRQSMMRKTDEAVRRMHEAERFVEHEKSDLIKENEDLLDKCEELANGLCSLQETNITTSERLETVEDELQCNEELMRLKDQECDTLRHQVALLEDGVFSSQLKRTLVEGQTTIKSLQQQVRKLQTQLSETAFKYEETVEIYRDNLILASQNLLDPDIREALLHIIELRQS